MIDDGIYFGMPESVYHGDDAIGSSDLRTLALSPQDWWWGSRYNELRPERKSDALTLGKMIHARLLEGADAMAERYEMYDHDLRSKANQAHVADIETAGRIPVKKDLWDRAMDARTFLRLNDSVRRMYSDGAAEVSCFWHDERTGLRLKSRIDWVMREGIADLKTFEPRETRGMANEVRRAMSTDYLYPAQAAHYLDGTAQMRRLWYEGKFYGGSANDLQIVQECLMDAPKMAFYFVFYKTTGAPQSQIIRIDWNSPLIARAQSVIERGKDNYQAGVKKWGLKTPWIDDTPPERFFEEDCLPSSPLFMREK